MGHRLWYKEFPLHKAMPEASNFAKSADLFEK